MAGATLPSMASATLDTPSCDHIIARAPRQVPFVHKALQGSPRCREGAYYTAPHAVPRIESAAAREHGAMLVLIMPTDAQICTFLGVNLVHWCFQLCDRDR